MRSAPFTKECSSEQLCNILKSVPKVGFTMHEWALAEAVISAVSETAAKEKGLAVFSRIDHAGAAAKIQEKLRPTELIIVGSPAVGTKLMLCGQTIGIDLPLKALIWQDDKGAVMLSYNDPAYLAQRHNLKGCDPVVKKIGDMLSSLANVAIAP